MMADYQKMPYKNTVFEAGIKFKSGLHAVYICEASGIKCVILYRCDISDTEPVGADFDVQIICIQCKFTRCIGLDKAELVDCEVIV